MLRGVNTPARLLITCTTPSSVLASASCLAGTRFASFTTKHRPSPPGPPSDRTNAGPVKSGFKAGLKPESTSGAAGLKPISKQQSKSKDPPSKLRDERIPHKRVRLVDPDTGTLGPFTPLEDVIKAARRRAASNAAEETGSGEDKKVKWWKQRRYCVELVVEKPDPIVKLVDIAETYHKNRETAKKKKESIIKEKEIQMTWSVAQGDFEHKMRKTREALEEGDRVTIGFARKKGQPYPKPEEMAAKLEETAQSLADVAEEWKPRVVQPNHTGFLYIQRKS